MVCICNFYREISEEAVNQDDTEDYNNIKDKTFRTLNDKHQRIKLALEKIEEEHKKQAVLQQFQNQPVRGLLENIPMTSYQASINNNIPKPPQTLECPEFCRKHGIFSYSNFYSFSLFYVFCYFYKELKRRVLASKVVLKPANTLFVICHMKHLD